MSPEKGTSQIQAGSGSTTANLTSLEDVARAVRHATNELHEQLCQITCRLNGVPPTPTNQEVPEEVDEVQPISRIQKLVCRTREVIAGCEIIAGDIGNQLT